MIYSHQQRVKIFLNNNETYPVTYTSSNGLILVDIL